MGEFDVVVVASFVLGRKTRIEKWMGEQNETIARASYLVAVAAGLALAVIVPGRQHLTKINGDIITTPTEFCITR